MIEFKRLFLKIADLRFGFFEGNLVGIFAFIIFMVSAAGSGEGFFESYSIACTTFGAYLAFLMIIQVLSLFEKHK